MTRAFGHPRGTHFHFPRAALRAGTFAPAAESRPGANS
jgi:hypothetical protein